MFNITEEDWEKIEEWKSKHPKYPEVHEGASGGRYTYSFTPTTLGCVFKVFDWITKEKIDLTNYEDW